MSGKNIIITNKTQLSVIRANYLGYNYGVNECNIIAKQNPYLVLTRQYSMFTEEDLSDIYVSKYEIITEEEFLSRVDYLYDEIKDHKKSIQGLLEEIELLKKQ